MSLASETFDRVLCGTDGTPAAEVALRQALILAPARSRLVVASVAPLAAAPHPQSVPALRIQAYGALMSARRLAGGREVEEVEFEGEPASSLLRAASGMEATLLVVGAHPGGRARGMLAASIAAAVIHRADCSVLVARPPSDLKEWPARVVVGTDGSSCARRAVEVAEHLAAARQRSLVIVAADGVQLKPGDLPAFCVGRRAPR